MIFLLEVTRLLCFLIRHRLQGDMVFLLPY
jgi:hypothetical protein